MELHDLVLVGIFLGLGGRSVRDVLGSSGMELCGGEVLCTIAD